MNDNKILRQGLIQIRAAVNHGENRVLTNDQLREVAGYIDSLEKAVAGLGFDGRCPRCFETLTPPPQPSP